MPQSKIDLRQAGHAYNGEAIGVDMGLTSKDWRIVLLAALMAFAQLAAALERCGSAPMPADVCLEQCVLADETAGSVDQPLPASAAPAPRATPNFTVRPVSAARIAPCYAPSRVGPALQILYCSFQT